jgi:hypothetical protein
MSYVPPSGSAARDCILQFDPVVGAISVVGVTDSTAASGKLTYIGDSLFARSTKQGAFEVWNAASGLALFSSGPISNSEARTYIDRLTPDLVALTSAQGDTLTTFSLGSTATQQHAISGSVIEQAKATAQSTYAKSGMSSRVKIGIIPATGSDGKGVVQALIFPYSSGGAPTLAGIDATGIATPLGACQPSPAVSSVVAKLIKTTGELGVVYFSGAVLWYSAS